NADGVIGTAGQAGAYRCVRPGSRVALGLGYRYTGGAEVVWGIPWVVERVEWRDGKGVGQLIVSCVDLFGALGWAVLADDVSLGNVTVAYLADRVLWRLLEANTAGLDARFSGHTTYGAAYRSGDRLGVILERYLEALGLWGRFATAAGSADP